MAVHELAGKPVPPEMLINVPALVAGYFCDTPDTENPAQQVSFGTSGHRGTAFKQSFNEAHILAITQAICEYRVRENISGPVFLGKDTHALSEAALMTAAEVLAGNAQTFFLDEQMGYTPTPVVSHAILSWNRQHKNALADGIIITPSHNPPEDGGFKYNPPTGGPADTSITRGVQDRANAIMRNDLKDVKRIAFRSAMRSEFARKYDYITPYISDLENVVDMQAITTTGIKIGVDPMGGAGIAYWEPIAERYKLDLTRVNREIDPRFAFMSVDKDGKVRMDCSSPYAMAKLIKLRDNYDIAFGNDPDYDRHGIVTRASGLMNPNHYLAVAVNYLYSNRENWAATAKIGKTLVSSSMIDRVAADLGRDVAEVPVGFKWFVDGLLDGSYGFGGEESAGASFLRMDGSVWSTDKDGIIMDLLAAEIMAKTGRDPGEHYAALTEKFGQPIYERLQAEANREQKNVLKNLSPEMISTDSLAGERITQTLTHAPGNGAAIGGLKVATENGWFAARPSGTEEIYKIYAESFLGNAHLERLKSEAQEIVNAAFKQAGV